MANVTILTSGGLAMMRDFLKAPNRDEVPKPPSYIVLASGTAPAGRFHTSLQGETFRAPIVHRETNGDSMTFYAFLSEAEGNGGGSGSVVRQYGILAGDVDALPDGPGTLVAVANEGAPFSKDATKTLTVSLVMTVSGTIT